MSKRRLSATVDVDLVRAAEHAVSQGLAESVSAWINGAMRRQLEHDERLSALREFISAYEAEHGEISKAEVATASERARARAIIVRGGTARKAPRAARTPAYVTRTGKRKSA